MTYILTLGNQKGGCSKTSSCLNLCYGLSQLGKKVLLIDQDSQGSAGLCLSIPIESDEINTIDILLDALVMNPNMDLQWDVVKDFIYSPTYVDRVRDPENPMKWIDQDTYFGFDCMPSSLNLSVVELKMGLAGGVTKSGLRTDYLTKIVDVIIKNADYDYIIIDTAPSLSALTLGSMATAKDGIIVVSSLDVMSIRGISTFIETTETIRKKIPNHKGIIGILLALYSERRVIDRSIDDWVKDFLPIPTFKTRIPESGYFKKANSALLLASQLDKKVYNAFISFAQEVIGITEGNGE